MKPKDIDKIFFNQVNIYTNKYGVKHTTYSDTLSDICKYELGCKFNGVYSVDDFPVNSLQSNSLFSIVNTQKSTQKGNHWVAIYTTPTRYYIYDSFGRKSTHILKPLVKRLKKTNKTIIDSHYSSEQHINEKNCGLKCLSWLMCVKKYGIYTAIKI